MRSRFLIPFVSTILFLSESEAKFPEVFDEPLEVVAFGSCNRDELPQPLWPVIASKSPDLWVWLGDNIYADWYEPIGGRSTRGDGSPAWMQQRYYSQFNREDYRDFRERFPIIGTWDDHDYGKNNAGRELSIKREAKELAMDFFEVPADDPRRSREGLYGSYDFGPDGKRTRVILLDGRYFASGKKAKKPTLLGEAQKEWVEGQLADPAVDLFLVASGIQILSDKHRYEKWENYPEEREWLLREIAQTGAKAVLLSGDRHIHEISLLEDFAGDYPLMEITSSGLTHAWDTFPGEINPYRQGEVFTGLGFGLLRIDWTGKSPTVNALLVDQDGTVQGSQSVSF